MHGHVGHLSSPFLGVMLREGYSLDDEDQALEAGDVSL
jgi:hypothetical protein